MKVFLTKILGNQVNQNLQVYPKNANLNIWKSAIHVIHHINILGEYGSPQQIPEKKHLAELNIHS